MSYTSQKRYMPPPSAAAPSLGRSLGSHEAGSSRPVASEPCDELLPHFPPIILRRRSARQELCSHLKPSSGELDLPEPAPASFRKKRRAAQAKNHPEPRRSANAGRQAGGTQPEARPGVQKNRLIPTSVGWILWLGERFGAPAHPGGHTNLWPHALQVTTSFGRLLVAIRAESGPAGLRQGAPRTPWPSAQTSPWAGRRPRSGR